MRIQRRLHEKETYIHTESEGRLIKKCSGLDVGKTDVQHEQRTNQLLPTGRNKRLAIWSRTAPLILSLHRCHEDLREPRHRAEKVNHRQNEAADF